MAARMSVEILQGEVSCSICLGLFQDPVSIHCGHSFCWACITRHWEGRTTDFPCPQCRETAPQQSLRPNQDLAKITAAAKSLNLQRVREAEGEENLCEKHQEPLKLFCKDEEKLMCVVCDRSKVHREHSVVPVDEAAQEYKEQIQTQLQRLKLEQERLQSSVEHREERVQDYTKKTEAEKQKIVTEHKQLHKFLEEQESFLLAQLEQLHTEIMNVHGEILTRLLEETTSLVSLTGEMERLCQQPDCELLKDIKTTLSRCKRETFSQSLDISPELEKKFCDFTEKTAAIKEAMEKFQGTLKELNLPLTTQVTLDPNTAHAELYLSEECRVVRWEPQKQDLPRNPERFKLYPCALGSRGFTWGWHSWEVEVSREDMWAIGVAKESVPREGFYLLEPKEGIWALCHIGEEYEILNFSCNTRLTLRSVPQRIRVYLDCQEGKVMFYDAVSKDQIFAFPRSSFKGEKVYPWFMVLRDAHLKLVSQGTVKKAKQLHPLTPGKKNRV